MNAHITVMNIVRFIVKTQLNNLQISSNIPQQERLVQISHILHEISLV
jgi:hypothetical protein